METQQLEWFARCLGIARIGPFTSQTAANQAVMTTEGEPAKDAYTWSEPKRARSRGRS